MSTAAADTYVARKPTGRPLGVWVLTLYDGLFVGLLPLLSTLVVLVLQWRGQLGPETEFALVPLVVALTMEVGVVTASVGAWRGSARARDLLVALLALHFILLLLQNVPVILDGSAQGRVVASTWGRIFRIALMLAVNAWYFLGGRTRSFYR
jgi:hypothetical protein